MNRINDFGLKYYSGTWVIILPPLKEIWPTSAETFAATTVTKHYKNQTHNNHSYIRQEGQMVAYTGIFLFQLLLRDEFLYVFHSVTG
jgi:hypothetical protein